MGMNYDEDALRALVEQGASLDDLAGEVGASKDALRHALRRRGLRATHTWTQNIRARVQPMRASDAVNYLLDCLEMLAPAMTTDERHPVDDIGPHWTKSERRVLVVLWDAGGAYVRHDALMNALYFDRAGDHPDEKIISVLLSKIRAKVRQGVCKVPLRIHSRHNFGYQLVTTGDTE
jgi:DNA-binding response OmpR family regulator